MAFIINRRGLLTASAAGLALATLPGRALAQQFTGFTHGVASGDPRQRSVTLWTRYVASSPTRLRVDIAEDEAFQRIAMSGDIEASPVFDHCAHARVDGLQPGRWYYYRFTAADGAVSETGRTRTLPPAGAERFRMASSAAPTARQAGSTLTPTPPHAMISTSSSTPATTSTRAPSRAPTPSPASHRHAASRLPAKS